MNQTYIQDNSILQSHEEKWDTIQCIDTKKNIAFHMLSWCKRVRDRFDHYVDDESEIPEPNSIIEVDNFIDINQHYSTWECHVNVWRVRFNEVYSITT
jgi:hypothetical protein